MKQHILLRRLVCLLLLAMPCLLQVSAQEIIRVTGKVVLKDKRTPLLGVNVTDVPSQRIMASTDEDGRFAIDVRSNTTLRFSMIGADPISIKVKGRNYLEVEMTEQDIFLGEATVKAKRITDKVTPEPTTIEVRGNYHIIRTRVRVPKEMFSHDTRLVVQPIYNNVTRNELKLMKPMVYDARTYNRTQQRMYNFQIDSTGGDPLAKYITVKSKETREEDRSNDIIGYSDSIYMKDARDNAICEIYMAIENYHRIVYRDTTTIARGTVNPLRWLNYSFGSSEITDSTLYPKAEKQMRDSKGQINLRFAIGKATLNTEDPQNVAEAEKLRQQIDVIRQTRDATLQALTISGTSSPDGRYTSNLRLAQQRMDFALKYLQGQVPAEMRKGMTFSSQAGVATWSDVAKLMRADSLFDEAKQVEELISRNSKSIDAQSRAMRRLPFYAKLLEGKYLPQLRRVDYTMNYSIFRQLTPEEIKVLYAEDYRQLSRFEFFQLYRNEKDPVQKEKELRQALEIYPSFMVAANDLQALLIDRQASDPELLAPFAGERAPAVLNTNHAIALLAAGRYSAADSAMVFVPQNEQYKLLHAVTGALNGRYQENFATVANTGRQNELVMLLAMKRNKEALELSKSLPDDKAISHYLRATCLNRLEKPVEAYDELKKAFKLDPSLEKTAKVDGDVNDLILDKK